MAVACKRNCLDFWNLCKCLQNFVNVEALSPRSQFDHRMNFLLAPSSTYQPLQFDITCHCLILLAITTPMANAETNAHDAWSNFKSIICRKYLNVFTCTGIKHKRSIVYSHN